jgi:hypothetical protein
MWAKLSLDIGVTLLDHKLPELLLDSGFVTAEKLDFLHWRSFPSYY